MFVVLVNGAENVKAFSLFVLNDDVEEIKLLDIPDTDKYE